MGRINVELSKSFLASFDPCTCLLCPSIPVSVCYICTYVHARCSFKGISGHECILILHIRPVVLACVYVNVEHVYVFDSMQDV